MEEEGKKEKKENSTELQRPNIEAEVYNNSKKCDWIYTYTPISKIKTAQQKYSTIDWPGKQREAKVMSNRMKLTKAQTGKQN